MSTHKSSEDTNTQTYSNNSLHCLMCLQPDALVNIISYINIQFFTVYKKTLLVWTKKTNTRVIQLLIKATRHIPHYLATEALPYKAYYYSTSLLVITIVSLRDSSCEYCVVLYFVPHARFFQMLSLKLTGLGFVV